MSQPQPAPDEEQKDLAIVTACIQYPSKKAWSEFFRRFEDRLRLWVRSPLHDSSDAEIEDAFQLLAEELISGKTLRTFKPTEAPAPYLRTCARNVALGVRRKRVRKSELPLDSETVPIKHLQLLADRAEPAPESEIVKRLKAGIRSSVRRQKRLKIFLTLLDELLAEHTIQQMTDKTKLSPSSVYRYLADLENLSYTSLGVVARPRPKKV